jgi:Acetyltransferase (GNAT) domain
MSIEEKYYVSFISHTDEFSPHFFVRKDFLDYQSTVFGKEIICLGVLSKKDQSLLGYCAFAGNNGHWQTPITGAFGGVVTKKNISVEALQFLVENIPDQIASRGSLKSIQIKLPPSSFPDNSPLVANILQRHNWSISSFDVNYHLNIRSIDKYLSGLGETKRKFIRRLQAAGAEFQEADRSMIEAVYVVIERNRSAQGYPMTMSLHSMLALLQRFKSDIRLFTVTLNTQIVASAICIQVDPKYLYVFYWGELPEYRKESPVLLLSMGIMEFCCSNNFEFMDIGTSSLNSLPNPGLCDFKSSLGCNVTQKLTYIWNQKN